MTRLNELLVKKLGIKYKLHGAPWISIVEILKKEISNGTSKEKILEMIEEHKDEWHPDVVRAIKNNI